MDDRPTPPNRGAAAGDADDHRTLHLQLSRADDMFEMPQTDLFSEYRNFLTGVDYCISELRSHPRRTPVRLQLELPSSEIDHQTEGQVRGTLRRYCDHRLSYNQRERRAVRLDGMSSLRVGIPVAIVGFLVALLGARATGTSGNTTVVLDTGGWVLAWVGLWFPLDTLLFTPLGFGRENQVLLLLREAPVEIRPRAADALG
ncbi:MAG: hypothetical protein ACRDYE_09770 [Acidimicrobiales bacterium]